MKKILTLLAVLALAVSLCVPAFAFPGGFVSSPSLNDGPALEDTDAAPGLRLVVTAYADRATLNKEMKADFEAAYENIYSTPDLSQLVPSIAEYTGVDAGNLAVSDLFHVHVEEAPATAAEKANAYTLTVSCRTLNKFEALLHRTAEGWQIVDSAALTEEGFVKFTTQELGVFAVVVDVENGGATPPSGDIFPLVAAGLLLTAAAFVALILFKGRKTA